MNVLVADDHLVTRRIIQKVLDTAGHKALLAEDGLSAWELVQKNNIRMVITDWMMPHMNGLALCRKIREAKFSSYVYVIVLTGNDVKEGVIEGLDAGADNFVVKPIDADQLLAHIRSGQRIIQLEEKYQTAYTQFLQSEKMASIGQLAAGIAHEINTPTQYVGDNARFLQDAFVDLREILGKYDQLLKAVKDIRVPCDLIQEVEAAVEEADLTYLMEEIPKAIEQSRDGVERVSRIVRAMKEFSHPGIEEKTTVDINKSLESTITVARNEWKYVAEMVTDFDSRLPLVTCLPGELNQVFLNMIINAAHSIADVGGQASDGKGTITISTRPDGSWVEIRISDTGAGIPEKIRSRIFDLFFTTKEVGRGTGQGLAIARSAIVDKHGGTMTFDTQLGEGTTFIVRLPI
jgi:two-component system NtrC family sensor kinase